MAMALRPTIRCSSCDALFAADDIYCRRCDAMGSLGGVRALQASLSQRVVRVGGLSVAGMALLGTATLTVIRHTDAELYERVLAVLHPTASDDEMDTLPTRSSPATERRIREIRTRASTLDGVDGNTTAIPAGRLIATTMRLVFMPDGDSTGHAFALPYATIVAVKADSEPRGLTAADSAAARAILTLRVRADEGTLTFAVMRDSTYSIGPFLVAVEAQRERALRRAAALAASAPTPPTQPQSAADTGLGHDTTAAHGSRTTTPPIATPPAPTPTAPRTP
jgi:hypothetical protein